MTEASILFDGWLLAYKPNSLPAIHLWELLVSCPDGFQAVVALPAPTTKALPKKIQAIFQPMQKSAWDRLIWEQRQLPSLARQVGARFIHSVARSAPLLSRVPVIVSDVDYETSPLHPSQSLPERLYVSLGKGGLARARAILQPEDIAFRTSKPVQQVKPFALSSLLHPSKQDLPAELGDSFVLYHGPGDVASLDHLIGAWSWAALAVGSSTSLVLAGLSPQPIELIPRLTVHYETRGKVIILPDMSLEEIAELYQECRALLHPAPLTQWGEPVRTALAAGKPVVAALTRSAEILSGPAAYLVAKEDSRGLGAALISVLVDQDLADRLAQAARERSAPWRETTPSQALKPVYQRLLESLG